jgi:hypothetical protein
MRGQSIAEYALFISVVLGVLLGVRIFLTRAARDVSIKTIMQLANTEDFALNSRGEEKTFEKAGVPTSVSGEDGTQTERVDFLAGGAASRQAGGTMTTRFSAATSQGD